jgi:hypothetical protein
MTNGPDYCCFAAEETETVNETANEYNFAMTNGLDSCYFAVKETTNEITNETTNEYNSALAIGQVGLRSIATIPGTAFGESYYGCVASFDDAILLVEALQQGMISQHFKPKEIRAGSVYLCTANKWTDGKRWKARIKRQDFTVLTEEVHPQVCLTKSMFYIHNKSGNRNIRLISYSTPDSR